MERHCEGGGKNVIINLIETNIPDSVIIDKLGYISNIKSLSLGGKRRL